MKSLFALFLFCLVVSLTSATCQFTQFQGAQYSLISTNSDWFASNTTCANCGGYMMGMPSGVEKTFVDQTLAANVISGSTAWVALRTDFWCSFYTIKSSKQFSGTNCMGSLQYVLCKKD